MVILAVIFPVAYRADLEATSSEKREIGAARTPIRLRLFSRVRNVLKRRHLLANVQDEPRPQPARLVLLGARDVTDVVVGSGVLLGRSRV